MPTRSNIFRDPVPTDPRLAINLPCVLQNEGQSTHATVRNINYSGLQVVLPEDASNNRFRDLKGVEIAQVGTFDVSVVWHRYGRLGLKFTERQAAILLLNPYFDVIGICP